MIRAGLILIAFFAANHAAASDRYCLVVWERRGCIACERFRRDYFNPAETSFRATIDRFFVLKVADVEKPEMARRAAWMAIGSRGFPVFRVTSIGGHELKRINGYHGPDWLLAQLQISRFRPKLGSSQPATRPQPAAPRPSRQKTNDPRPPTVTPGPNNPTPFQPAAPVRDAPPKQPALPAPTPVDRARELDAIAKVGRSVDDLADRERRRHTEQLDELTQIGRNVSQIGGNVSAIADSVSRIESSDIAKRSDVQNVADAVGRVAANVGQINATVGIVRQRLDVELTSRPDPYATRGAAANPSGQSPRPRYPFDPPAESPGQRNVLEILLKSGLGAAGAAFGVPPWLTWTISGVGLTGLGWLGRRIWRRRPKPSQFGSKTRIQNENLTEAAVDDESPHKTENRYIERTTDRIAEMYREAIRREANHVKTTSPQTVDSLRRIEATVKQMSHGLGVQNRAEDRAAQPDSKPGIWSDEP